MLVWNLLLRGLAAAVAKELHVVMTCLEMVDMGTAIGVFNMIDS